MANLTLDPISLTNFVSEWGLTITSYNRYAYRKVARHILGIISGIFLVSELEGGEAAEKSPKKCVFTQSANADTEQEKKETREKKNRK